MRSILRKINQGEELEEEEYARLLSYADNLRVSSPESYKVFYEQYASRLYRDYSTYMPRFSQDFDELVAYLGERPEALHFLALNPLPLEEFPTVLHPYLRYAFNEETDTRELKAIRLLTPDVVDHDTLPRRREGPIVFKYEDDNEGKEMGLKAHFARLERYFFISRLQTYRYLSRNKAASDRFEYIDKDRLGGIFTNKYKSIYYLIFLTEKDSLKAQNACRLLNIAFYGRANY